MNVKRQDSSSETATNMQTENKDGGLGTYSLIATAVMIGWGLWVWMGG